MVTGTAGVALWLTAAAASVSVGQALGLGDTHLSQLSSILTTIPEVSVVHTSMSAQPDPSTVDT